MAVRKIKAGRVSTVSVDTFVGEQGTIFYDDVTGEIRLADGITVGGVMTFSTGNILAIDGGTAATSYTAEITVDGGGA